MIDDRQQSETTRSFQAAARSGAQTMSDMARQGAEAMHRASDAASETTNRGAQALAEGQRALAQAAAERFADMSQRAAQAVQATTEDMRALMVLPNAARGGLRDMQQGFANLADETVRTNVRAAQELFRLYNPSTVIELQQRFAREYLSAFLEGSAALVRAARRTADEALQPLEQQIERRRQQANEDQRRYRHAAE